MKIKEQINLSSINSISTSSKDTLSSEFSLSVSLVDNMTRRIQNNETSSVNSDYPADSSSKLIRLRAPDAQTRLLWVKVIETASKKCFDHEI